MIILLVNFHFSHTWSIIITISACFNGNFRILKWRYLPYIRLIKGLCKGISPQNMAKNMVQYLPRHRPGRPPWESSSPCAVRRTRRCCRRCCNGSRCTCCKRCRCRRRSTIGDVTVELRDVRILYIRNGDIYTYIRIHSVYI